MPNAECCKFDDFIHYKYPCLSKPLICQFELTFRCNLKCPHCYCVEDKSQKELSFKEITSILDQLADAACLWLSFTGGEPLVREDFLDIYLYAKKKGFVITVFTNATLINRKIISLFKRYPPFSIEISLNGLDDEVYDKVTGSQGRIKRVMQNIRALHKLPSTLVIKSMGLKQNLGQILKIKSFAELIQARFRFDYLILPRIDGLKAPFNYRLSSEDILNMEIKDKQMRQELLDKFNKEHLPDDAGIVFFWINPYGGLFLCRYMRNYVFDLKSKPFKQGFYEFLPRVIRENCKPLDKCLNCGLKDLCDSCPGLGRLESGDKNLFSEYCCGHAHAIKEKRLLLNAGT